MAAVSSAESVRQTAMKVATDIVVAAEKSGKDAEGTLALVQGITAQVETFLKGTQAAAVPAPAASEPAPAAASGPVEQF